MDKLHYGRVAAAGWLFVLVVVANLWAADAPQWHALKALVVSDKPTAILAIVTAIAGLGGPPAVGLILDRLAALALLTARRSMWNLRFNEAFSKLLVDEADLKVKESISSPGAFHAFFYTYADSRLIDWMRRRTTYAYGSVISSMAIISGMVVARFAFKAYSLGVLFFSLFIIVALLIYAYIATRGISETGEAWVSTIGRLAVKQFKEELLATPEGQQVAKKGAHSMRSTASAAR